MNGLIGYESLHQSRSYLQLQVSKLFGEDPSSMLQLHMSALIHLGAPSPSRTPTPPIPTRLLPGISYPNHYARSGEYIDGKDAEGTAVMT